MNDRLASLVPSFPPLYLGSLRIRISWLFLPAILVLTLRFGFRLGMTLAGAIIVFVLLHELGHVICARLTGGAATEVHLTPLGGLATVQPGRGSRAMVLTALAGPLVNLLACVASWPGYYSPEHQWAVFNPFVMPIAKLSEDHPARDLGLIVFAINWLLLVVNLLPIVPLDGSKVLAAWLSTKTHPEVVDRAAMRFSLLAASVLAFLGLFGDWSAVVFVAGVLFIFNLLMLMESHIAASQQTMLFDPVFHENDSESARSGREDDDGPVDIERELIDDWRERRQRRQLAEERRRTEEAERQLDELLAKVHEQGIDSLTAAEQRLLKHVSEILREKGRRSS